jgi:hypothetical protein
MNEKRSSLLLSLLLGGLIGGGITFLLTSRLMRTRRAKPARANRKWSVSDEMREQSYEEGIYCAPEGADTHRDLENDIYYSKDE